MSKGKKKIWSVASFALLGLLLLSVTGCNNGGTNRSTSENTTKNNGETIQSLLGIVTSVDDTQSQIVVRELESDVTITLSYDATANIKDKYKEKITGDEVEIGSILKVKYKLGNGKVVSMVVPDQVWEYQDVDKFKITSDENAFSCAGEKYQYSTLTLVSTLEKTIELMELNEKDVLTVRGIGYKVYSIVRTKGHGYIRLTNYKDFIGGMIEVGNGIILPITNNMLVTAGEGNYQVILSNATMTATKNVTVRSDDEIDLDFSEYKAKTKNIGNITFAIEPGGADLTINGTKVNYSSPIPLSYGTYQIGVTMTGYGDYSGTLDVEESASTVTINLIEEQAEVGTDATSTPSSTSTSSTSSTTKTVDSDHSITVSAPEGAEVYLDNVYKGLAPCTFTKVLGSQTLTLSKDGCITKSYSVDILDDSEDVKLSFSDLVEDAD